MRVSLPYISIDLRLVWAEDQLRKSIIPLSKLTFSLVTFRTPANSSLKKGVLQ